MLALAESCRRRLEMYSMKSEVFVFEGKVHARMVQLKTQVSTVVTFCRVQVVGKFGRRPEASKFITCWFEGGKGLVEAFVANVFARHWKNDTNYIGGKKNAKVCSLLTYMEVHLKVHTLYKNVRVYLFIFFLLYWASFVWERETYGPL